MPRPLMILGLMAGLIATAAPSEAEARRRAVVTVVVPAAQPPPPARVWVPAHQVWDARMQRHVVVPGHWKIPPRAHVAWVPGHWELRGRNKRIWVPGQWVR